MTSSTPDPFTDRFYDIPPLENDGSNFRAWKFRISTVLELRDLMGIVDGSVKCPDPIFDKNSNIVTNQVDIDAWAHNNREAKAQIILSLEDEPLRGILHTTTASDAWDKLNERYEGKGLHTIVHLIQEIFHASFSDEMPMAPQLYEVRYKAHILKTLGEPISDAVIAYAMLLALPGSYSALRTFLSSSLATSGDSSLSTDTVITQVLNMERTVKLDSSQAKGKCASRSNAGVAQKELKCHYCEKKGHMKAECKKSKADQAVGDGR